MSASGVQALERADQATQAWLDEVAAEIGVDRQLAWKLLGVVLRRLRDSLPVALAADLGDELPLPIRGAYYDGFQPKRPAERPDSLRSFCAGIGERLQELGAIPPQAAASAVFAVLSRHLAEAQIRRLQRHLPRGLRDAWETVEEGLQARGDLGDAAGVDAGF